MSVWNRMMCAIDRVIRTNWCMPDDIDRTPRSDERLEVERALCAEPDEHDHRSASRHIR